MLWPFDYVKPENEREITEILAKNPDNTKILAGGSNILLDMEQGLFNPSLLIDIKGSKAQMEIFEDREKSQICIGSGVPIAQCIRCDEHTKKTPTWKLLALSGKSLATSTIRNRATIAGNLAYASPASDMAPAMLVLGATIKIAGPKTDEYIDLPVQDFFVGVKKSCLKKGQWITRIDLPVHPETTKVHFEKRQRVKGHDLAIVNGAGLRDRERGIFRIAIGSCATVPLYFQLDDISQLTEKDKILAHLEDRVIKNLKPISDIRATAEYRFDMARHILAKILDQIL